MLTLLGSYLFIIILMDWFNTSYQIHVHNSNNVFSMTYFQEMKKPFLSHHKLNLSTNQLLLIMVRWWQLMVNILWESWLFLHYKGLLHKRDLMNFISNPFIFCISSTFSFCSDLFGFHIDIDWDTTSKENIKANDVKNHS